MRITLLYTSLTLILGLTANAQQGAPPVIRVFVEQLKPGKTAAHNRSESAMARVFAKANFPAHYIGLEAMSGPNDVWFVEAHDSFAAVEKSEKAADAEPLKSEADQAFASDGEYLSGSRSFIGVFRKDLSWDPESAPTLSKTRYMNIITIRLKMGAEPRLIATVNEMQKIYRNMSMPQAILVYQIISGAQSGTYMLFEPIATLADWDKFPALMQAIKETAGRKFDALEKDFADITAFEEGRLMSINPQISYVSKDIVRGDPAFWTPKDPAKATSKAAPKKRSAPRQTGQ